MKKAKKIRAWAVIHPDRGILWDTIRESRADSIEVIRTTNYDQWPFLRKELGYRIRRIRIEVED